MPDRTLVVFTYRPVAMMLEDGGSQAWALNPVNARRCTYLVCTRNRYFPGIAPEVQAAATEEHRSAFLVGRITTVEPSPERSDRFIVRFDQYALLDEIPNVWPSARNPVWYVNDVSELNIDPDALQWHSMPETDADTAGTTSPAAETTNGLTFDEARIGLAARYHVPAANIEIVIRG